jgi:hypothetical protein
MKVQVDLHFKFFSGTYAHPRSVKSFVCQNATGTNYPAACPRSSDPESFTRCCEINGQPTCCLPLELDDDRFHVTCPYSKHLQLRAMQVKHKHGTHSTSPNTVLPNLSQHCRIYATLNKYTTTFTNISTFKKYEHKFFKNMAKVGNHWKGLPTFSAVGKIQHF